MAVISIKSFAGISPKVPPRYLQDTQAQTAINCTVFAGSLQPLAGLGTSVTTLTKVGTPLTIYRFGQDEASDTQYWFHWTTDVNVCRSQLTGDTSEWTFFTDGVQPRATYAALATSGSDYPTASRPLGVPAATTAATVTAGATPEDTDALQETRVYVYTVVSKEAGFEFESAPSPASADITVYPTQEVTLSSFDSVPSGYNVTHRRIYRSTAGTFLFVAEITVATASYTDNVLAAALGEELPSLTWLPPPAALKGLTNMPGGWMAGFVGRDIYLCDPYRPHAWPLQYVQSVDAPIVGLGRMDTTLAVLTQSVPYFLQGSSPDSTTLVKSDLEQACVSKRSIASINGAVFFASPDGLVMLSPGGSRVITEPMFRRDQWQTLFNPSSITAFQHDSKYIGFYATNTTSGSFIYDVASGQFTVTDIFATAGYNDLRNDKLYLSSADRTVKPWLEGSAKTQTWKSKKFTMPHDLSFACAQLDAETYPVTVKHYVNGTLVHTQTAASRTPYRLPVAVGKDWEVQVEGTAEVFGITLAQSMQELAGV